MNREMPGCLANSSQVIFPVKQHVGLPIVCPQGVSRRAHLKVILGSIVKQQLQLHRARGFPDEAFSAVMTGIKSCGTKVYYKTLDDVPLDDTPCPCGDPNHWLVTWTIVDPQTGEQIYEQPTAS